MPSVSIQTSAISLDISVLCSSIIPGNGRLLLFVLPIFGISLVDIMCFILAEYVLCSTILCAKKNNVMKMTDCFFLKMAQSIWQLFSVHISVMAIKFGLP